MMNLARIYDERLCPVCGYKLDFTPWDGGEFVERSCPCCGIHFGYDDLIESQPAELWLPTFAFRG